VTRRPSSSVPSSLPSSARAPQWTVKADMLTAPQHVIDAPVYDAVRRSFT
jgi:hypothetical protein